MDDMPFAWLLARDDERRLVTGAAPPLVRPHGYLRAVTDAPVPPVVTVAELADIVRRLREDQASVTFMVNPVDEQRVDAALRKLAEEITAEGGRVREWTLTVSRHVPKGQVLSWRNGPDGRPGDPLPPVGIMRRRAT